MTTLTYDPDKKTTETLKKLFIGGLLETTDDDNLKAYFGKYGVISDCVVIKDQNKISRKFGFVTFEDMKSTNECIQEKPHTVDGKEVDVKRAIPRELGNITRGKKAFIGGIPKDLKEEELQEAFHACDLDLKVAEVLLIKDKPNNPTQNKGFGFVTFEEEDQVDKVATVRKFKLPSGKELEVKHAEPKNGEGGGRASGRGGRGGGMRGRGGRGGGFGGGQGYNQGYNDWGNGNGYGYDNYGGGYGGGYDQSYDNGYNNYDSYGAAQTQGYDQGGYGGGQGGYQGGGGGGGRRGGRGGGNRYQPY